MTDDDAIPDPSFLTAWSKYLSKHHDHQLFGGSIEPLFEVRPPEWMLRNKAQFDVLFAVRDLPEGPIAPDGIFGPNMAVRTSVFTNGLRFNENIGPNGSDPYYPMGDETEFCCRVARSGAKAWFAKEPRVQHIIRSNQLVAPTGLSVPINTAAVSRCKCGNAERLPRRMFHDHWWLNQLSRLLQMLSPFPLQRFNSVYDFHWSRGFWDEWTNRSTSRKRPDTRRNL